MICFDETEPEGEDEAEEVSFSLAAFVRFFVSLGAGSGAAAAGVMDGAGASFQ